MAQLDEKKLKELLTEELGGSRDFFQEIVKMFLTECDLLLVHLKEAAQLPSNAEQLRHLSHKLKGMGYHVGAIDFSKACETVELGCQSKATGDFRPQVEKCAEEYGKVKSLLREKLQQLGMRCV